MLGHVTDDDTGSLSDEQALIKLTWLLGLIGELTERYRKRPLTRFGRSGGDSVIDDAALGPLAPSWRIGNCLSIAVDQLHAVRVLLQPDPDGPIVVPFIGPYPNIRAALEAASLAVYLLEADAAGRRERTLTAAWDGVLQDERTIKAMCALTDDDDKAARSRKTKEQAGGMLQIKETRRAIRRVGAAANIKDSAYTKALPGFRTIVLKAAHGMSFSGNDARFVLGADERHGAPVLREERQPRSSGDHRSRRPTRRARTPGSAGVPPGHHRHGDHRSCEGPRPCLPAWKRPDDPLHPAAGRS